METGIIRRTPPSPSLNAADLNWLIGQFVVSRRRKLDNKETVDAYEDRLRWFVSWWGAVGPANGWILRPPDLEDFERYLRTEISPVTKRGLAYNTREAILMMLRDALHWAADNQYTDRNYAAWVPRAQGVPPKRIAAQESSLIALLDQAGASRYPLRNRAMIAMFIGMGLRRIEIHNLNVEKICFREDGSGHARVYGKRTVANPSGERDAAFEAETGVIVTGYIDSVGFTEGPLFRSNRGTRISVDAIYRAVKMLIAGAGLEEELQGCHDLRRGFTTFYARHRQGENSADLRRRQLGHAKYSQTTEYTLFDVDDIRRDMISPVSVAAKLRAHL